VNHVAFIIPGLDRIGGAERQLLLLAKGLRERGWLVSVVALSGTGGDAVLELQNARIEFVSLSMCKGLADPRGWVRFRRWLKTRNPDVVHAHLPHAVWMARWSRLGAPVRVMVDTLHSSSTGTVGRRLAYRLSDWLTDQVTAVSHAVSQSHVAAKMVARILVIPNGIDVHTWQPDLAVRNRVRRELGIGDEFLWVAAGRLEAVKDYPTLLRATASLSGAARLIIAGAGPLKEQLLQQVRELGIESRVRFLAFEPNLLPWMQAADGFVLASRWEGLPMALLEAAACGLPAVATDVPGTREAVVQGKTAWLVPQNDPEALAQSMNLLMLAPSDVIQRTGEQARDFVIDSFSLESVLDRWETLYTDLLNRHRKPNRWAKVQ
jgi:glycosyltransferase involved in cell wall biosynthesis